jgi:hypothetical protein
LGVGQAVRHWVLVPASGVRIPHSQPRFNLNKPYTPMNLLKKKREEIELKVQFGHEGIYYLRDIKYIIRVIRKIANYLPKKKKDIDWLQLHIESFLILNSRFYQDLILDLVKEVRKHNKLPGEFHIKKILEKHKNSISDIYHQEKLQYRHRATHGSNYQRIGIPEFGNDILPKPLSYELSPGPKLSNMTKRRDLIRMWQKDMLECADDIEKLFSEVVSELNSFKDLSTVR